MPRLRLPNYPEKEYFAHRFTFSDKMARAATRISKKTGPLPNLPDKLWWRRGSSRGGARRRENGPVNRFQREGGEAGSASPCSPRPDWRTTTRKKAGPLPNLPGELWWRRGESNGVCAARIRGACSAKRATGTFRDPRNASGVRFSNATVITKKQVSFPTCLFFWWRRGESNSGPY